MFSGHNSVTINMYCVGFQTEKKYKKIEFFMMQNYYNSLKNN